MDLNPDLQFGIHSISLCVIKFQLLRAWLWELSVDISAKLFCFLIELWISLEEHQDALELIMSKYRKQMLQLMVAKKAVDAEPVLKAHQSHSAVRNFDE